MDITRILLISAFGVGALAAQGVFFDFSEGFPSTEIGTTCGAANKPWSVKDAADYGISGPKEGKVAFSETPSCLAPQGLYNISEEFKFKIYLFAPPPPGVNKNPKFRLHLVSEDENYEGELEIKQSGEDWSEVEIDLKGYTKIPLPGFYKIEIWALSNVPSVAVRWFGISDENLPPPPETTTTSTITTESTTTLFTTPAGSTPTTTATVGSTTTTIGSTTTTIGSTTTTIGSTTTSPITQTPPLQPKPESTFPELYSVLLGAAIGIVFMSLLFFVSTCIWWLAIFRRKEPTTYPRKYLPRLEVVNQDGYGTSITGSTDANSYGSDPFWLKSKDWSHIPYSEGRHPIFKDTD